MDVGGWLRSLGLGQYEALFRASDIDADILPELTEVDLEKLGVSLGHRKRLLRAISGLGAETSAAPPASTGGRPQDAAERRQLTVMFCDLVGSTALSVRFDPEELREEIRAYQNTVSGVVARYDGFVARFMGDGVLAYFGYPRAHEDDAERAVRAGLEIAAAVTRLATRGTEPLAVRIGIATGLVVVGDLVGEGSAQEQAVVGETPNLAARLQALAQPGQIVLALATRRLVSDLFRLTDLGRQMAKGFAEPVEAFAVEGVAVAESRFEAARRGLSDLVGRVAESTLLRDRLREAWGGVGQIVLLSGEAGIGKSRLAAQLAAEVESEPHTRLRYQCSPYHRDSVLYPFVVQLGRAARIAPEDPTETQLKKLEAILVPSHITETAPLFASLLSIPTGERYPPLALSAAQQRRLTLAALLDQLEALARQKPVLMLFEDAHWADATSLEVLDLTARCGSGALDADRLGWRRDHTERLIGGVAGHGVDDLQIVHGRRGRRWRMTELAQDGELQVAVALTLATATPIARDRNGAADDGVERGHVRESACRRRYGRRSKGACSEDQNKYGLGTMIEGHLL